MPELPEVERFRSLLEPLISTKGGQQHVLRLERLTLDRAPPRKFLSDDDIAEIHTSQLVVSDVLRKGKLICMVLTPKTESKTKNKRKNYLMVHMGMTGRISNAAQIPKLMEVSDTSEYPPPHTYLKFVAGPYDACFSDPRKFGSVQLKDSMDDEFEALAPDAWKEVVTQSGKGKSKIVMVVDKTAIAKLAEQKLGIKALLLDQNRAVSGVGNYLADEVLYQLEMHPDQKYLTTKQAEMLLRKLFEILDTAIGHYGKEEDFPKEWLFHYRWGKGKKEGAKDCHGRTVTFLTSGGRTSDIVPSIQKLKGQKMAGTTKKAAKAVVTKTTTKTTTTTTKKKAVKAKSTVKMEQTVKLKVETTKKIRATKRDTIRKRKVEISPSSKPLETTKKLKRGSRKSPRSTS